MKIDEMIESELRVTMRTHIKAACPSWSLSEILEWMGAWTDEDMKACWVASATLHGSGNWDFDTWMKIRKENKGYDLKENLKPDGIYMAATEELSKPENVLVDLEIKLATAMKTSDEYQAEIVRLKNDVRNLNNDLEQKGEECSGLYMAKDIWLENYATLYSKDKQLMECLRELVEWYENTHHVEFELINKAKSLINK